MEKESEVLAFNSRTKDCAWLSNFFHSPFKRSDGTYDTVEHYFQAHKTTDKHLRAHIRRSATPYDAHRRGRAITLRPDWETVKAQIMRTALRAKFALPDFRKMLLATGKQELVHLAPWDAYWGTGRDGEGQNMLGKMIMKIRRDMNK